MSRHACDNGWIHECGGPHDAENPPPPSCSTVRCEQHCSCFTADDRHDKACALSGGND